MRSGTPGWMIRFSGLLAAGDGYGGYLVNLPEYRPDLAKALAHHLDFDFFDFRADVMSRLGFSAHTLELEAMGRSLESRAVHRGVLAFNLEALLGTKERSARQAWLSGFVRGRYAHPVVAPLALFCSDVDPSLPNTITIDPEELPKQSIINRLVN